MEITLLKKIIKKRTTANPNEVFHVDHSIPRNHERGLSINCEGCPHVRSGLCIYVETPKKKRFPCFFKVYVEPGGFDGQYTATIPRISHKGSTAIKVDGATE
jgi:hypothetical protein